jgi:ankyrin repeat protein
LIWASYNGKLDIVEYLLSKGANIEETAIYLAWNDNKIKEILKNAKKKEIKNS